MGCCDSKQEKQQAPMGYQHPKEDFSNTHPACRFAYCVESKSDFATTCAHLDEAVKRNAFGTLHVHKIDETLKNKGVEIAEKAHVYEVCNPKKAQQVLNTEMLMSLALPCRISVFTQAGKVFVAQMAPIALMQSMFEIDAVKKETMSAVASEVTATTEIIIKQACGVVEIPQA